MSPQADLVDHHVGHGESVPARAGPFRLELLGHRPDLGEDGRGLGDEFVDPGEQHLAYGGLHRQGYLLAVSPGGRCKLPPGAPSLDRVKAGRGSSVCQVNDQPGDLVGVTEIGDLLGVSRQRADQLSRLEGFPEPVAVLSAGRIWRLVDVEAWARTTGRLS